MKKSTRRRSRTPSPRKTISKRSTLLRTVLLSGALISALGLGIAIYGGNKLNREFAKSKLAHVITYYEKEYKPAMKEMKWLTWLLETRDEEIYEKLKDKEFPNKDQMVKYLTYNTKCIEMCFKIIESEYSIDRFSDLSNELLKISDSVKLGYEYLNQAIMKYERVMRSKNSENKLS